MLSDSTNFHATRVGYNDYSVLGATIALAQRRKKHAPAIRATVLAAVCPVSEGYIANNVA
jgi:hypothetical protein